MKRNITTMPCYACKGAKLKYSMGSDQSNFDAKSKKFNGKLKLKSKK